jgi:molecular chaperone GrpE
MNELAEERLLGQFRQWLAETRAEGESAPASEGQASSPESPVGLYRLIEEFTALRQEVKLQTKSARSLEETAETLSRALRQALEGLRSIEPREAQAAWSAGKGLAMALAEMDESLERGRLQLERAIEAIDRDPAEALDAAHAAWESQPGFKRWLSRGYYRAVCDALTVAAIDGAGDSPFAAMRDGFAIIQSRLSRLLAAEGIMRIPTEGEIVDPELMIVLETVASDDPPGAVVEEIRPGYLWNGRLLRCAEVRAARSW